jgi:hypothetical protein
MLTCIRRAENRHRQFHFALLAAAPTSDDVLVLAYYRSRFQIFY